MASIDKMSWHYGADDFPASLSNENAGTHIGLYLAWIIEHDMIGEEHREKAAEEIGRVLRHEWTGRDFLIEVCDEVFWNGDLNEAGRQFTATYYTNSGYYQDYKSLLPQGVEFYSFDNSWDNYEKVKAVLNMRYEAWRFKQNRWWRRLFRRYS